MTNKSSKQKKLEISEKETEFLINSAKALGWYQKKLKRQYTQQKIGDKISLTVSSISKYLIDPDSTNIFKVEDLETHSKRLLPLNYALQIAEAMDSNLWNILCSYDEYKKAPSKSTNLNEDNFLKDNKKENLPITEYLLTDVNHHKFRSWLGEYYCYFSSTSSEEINKPKQEDSKDMTKEEQELFDIIPSKDHIFCGKIKFSKASDNSCRVSLRFMSNKKSHDIKHYYGTLSLSQEHMAGFIALHCQENGEGSYIIAKSPDSKKLKCRMAMALTLSSIDGHRRACSEKMLITKEFIPESSPAYNALKAFLLMNDSYIRITEQGYGLLLNELKDSDNTELQKFAKDYPLLADLNKSNSTAIKTCKCAFIPESTIAHWNSLNDVSRDLLIILMRKYSIADWYYKANNENAKEILYIIENKKY